MTTGGRESDVPTTPEALAEALRAPGAVELMSTTLREQAAATPREALALALGPDPSAACDGRRLLFWLEELAVAPLVEPDPTSAELRVGLATSAVQAELELRRAVIARIDALVRHQVPVRDDAVTGAQDREDGRATGTPVEGAPLAPRRLCDVAYTCMRQMVSLPPDGTLPPGAGAARTPASAAETPAEAQEFAKAFREAPIHERDARIQTARKSRLWKNALTGKET